MHVCMYACMHVCMYACMHVCMYACMHDACMHACMYACMHVRMYVCIHVVSTHDLSIPPASCGSTMVRIRPPSSPTSSLRKRTQAGTKLLCGSITTQRPRFVCLCGTGADFQECLLPCVPFCPRHHARRRRREFVVSLCLFPAASAPPSPPALRDKLTADDLIGCVYVNTNDLELNTSVELELPLINPHLEKKLRQTSLTLQVRKIPQSTASAIDATERSVELPQSHESPHGSPEPGPPKSASRSSICVQHKAIHISSSSPVITSNLGFPDDGPENLVSQSGVRNGTLQHTFSPHSSLKSDAQLDTSMFGTRFQC